ncbi:MULTISPECIES: heme A synthase [unclassified Curtobacterium]|uniref:COX15/CtaA family protein n=1 Tax=unclassified Curtobacterium TaxID=257496 RepID=UPI0008DDBF2C|nr:MULTISPECIES: COX15/CtaA family protein [unclassified Curtobacterium]OIH98689.1 cytochrome oxidase assembly protein [Curtobacterium sp. MCBA15_003]OII14904.1 cytochrome oxidase assembly protein [Curtobacterium sp. MCBA15_009]OII32413.1 cytochrome oxidase assembly protein [Curtobacterium sp. MMLR14_006]
MTRVGTPVEQDVRSEPWWSLPRVVDARVVALAWASFVVEVLLIGTGGLVRLTASGLGCPTWPKCTAESLVSTPEMGIHGVIEFGNRLLTFVLVVVAVAMFLAVVRMLRTRPELFWLAFAQGVAIPVQAVIGGLSVLTSLNPFVVGLHFVVSAALTAVTAALVYRTVHGPRTADRLVPAWYTGVVRATVAAVVVTVLVGILTTGSGPHAGADEKVDGGRLHRTGFDPAVMEHVHAWPAYALFALTLVLVVGAVRLRLSSKWALLLLVVEFLQIAVGLTQARTGLPAGLVGTHMVLAGLLVGATTAVVLSTRGSAGRLALREPLDA